MTEFDASIMELLGQSWGKELLEEFHKPYMQRLMKTLREERQKYEVYPASGNVFRAFRVTPFTEVKVLILGQDPCHTPGMATGLAFSVPEDTLRIPPSLQNIFKEMESDLGWKGDAAQSPDLSRWSRQGVMLLNTCLTVRQEQAESHRALGWESFTRRVVERLSEEFRPVVFVLWGRSAQAYKPLIDPFSHWIIESPHPSPLSASRGFFGSRPFSRINEILDSEYGIEIDWFSPLDALGPSRMEETAPCKTVLPG